MRGDRDTVACRNGIVEHTGVVRLHEGDDLGVEAHGLDPPRQGRQRRLVGDQHEAAVAAWRESRSTRAADREGVANRGGARPRACGSCVAVQHEVEIELGSAGETALAEHRGGVVAAGEIAARC
jgi:hypothetical protein